MRSRTRRAGGSVGRDVGLARSAVLQLQVWGGDNQAERRPHGRGDHHVLEDACERPLRNALRDRPDPFLAGQPRKRRPDATRGSPHSANPLRRGRERPPRSSQGRFGGRWLLDSAGAVPQRITQGRPPRSLVGSFSGVALAAAWLRRVSGEQGGDASDILERRVLLRHVAREVPQRRPLRTAAFSAYRRVSASA
jgi:hypothetical protein